MVPLHRNYQVIIRPFPEGDSYEWSISFCMEERGRFWGSETKFYAESLMTVREMLRTRFAVAHWPHYLYDFNDILGYGSGLIQELNTNDDWDEAIIMHDRLKR